MYCHFSMNGFTQMEVRKCIMQDDSICMLAGCMASICQHMYTRPANPDTVTPVRLAIKTCEKTCKKFVSNVSRHDDAD